MYGVLRNLEFDFKDDRGATVWVCAHANGAYLHPTDPLTHPACVLQLPLGPMGQRTNRERGQRPTGRFTGKSHFKFYLIDIIHPLEATESESFFESPLEEIQARLLCEINRLTRKSKTCLGFEGEEFWCGATWSESTVGQLVKLQSHRCIQ